MKLQIKSLIALVAVSAVIVTGCSRAKENKTDALAEEEQLAIANADIRGQWYIENIVFSDSDYVRPDEAVPGVSQYIVFEDSTYFIMTNCNSMSGSYLWLLPILRINR